MLKFSSLLSRILSTLSRILLTVEEVQKLLDSDRRSRTHTRGYFNLLVANSNPSPFERRFLAKRSCHSHLPELQWPRLSYTITAYPTGYNSRPGHGCGSSRGHAALTTISFFLPLRIPTPSLRILALDLSELSACLSTQLPQSLVLSIDVLLRLCYGEEGYDNCKLAQVSPNTKTLFPFLKPSKVP